MILSAVLLLSDLVVGWPGECRESSKCYVHGKNGNYFPHSAADFINHLGRCSEFHRPGKSCISQFQETERGVFREVRKVASRRQGEDGDGDGDGNSKKRSRARVLQGRLLIHLPALSSLFSSPVPQPQRELCLPRASEFQGSKPNKSAPGHSRVSNSSHLSRQ